MSRCDGQDELRDLGMESGNDFQLQVASEIREGRDAE